MKTPLFLLALVAIAPSWALGEPHIPQNDAVVLERLPTRLNDTAGRELRRLRTRASSGDPDASATLARRYFDLAMAEGDPRYVGYAEGALRPWRDAQDAPVELLMLRGMLRQYRHDFPGGLADFERVLARDPRNAEARSWRAAIFMVQADYAAARRECEALREVATELIAVGCQAHVDAATGDATGAHERLLGALKRRDSVPGALRVWTLTRLAEFAERIGKPELAERHFRDALKVGIDDNYLLAAYADLLLREQRPAEVLKLLAGRERSDTLLLRIALAARKLKAREAPTYAAMLEDRFAAAAQRGERLHLAEEARFRLAVKEDARGALQAAAENWRSQREPRDAEILLQAAVAANDAGAATPALRWLSESRFEDPRLREMARQLEAPSR
jgi:hypothetical protein